MNNLIAQVYENVIFLNKIDIPMILGRGAPSFRQQFSGSVLPLPQNVSALVWSPTAGPRRK